MNRYIVRRGLQIWIAGLLWIAAAQAYELTVQVNTRQGAGVAGAEVMVVGGSRGIAFKGMTNGAGLASFVVAEPGSYTVTIHSDAHRTFTEKIEIRNPSFGMIAVLSAQAVYGLDLTVVDTAGKAVENAWVEIRAAEQLPAIHGRPTNAEGKVSFNMSLPADYIAQVSKDFHDTAVATVAAQKTLTRESYTIKLSSQQARLLISVKSEDRNEIIPGASVQVLGAAGRVLSADRMATDLTGVAPIIMASRQSGSASETYDLQVSHPDYESKTASVKADFGQYKDYPVEVLLKRKAGGRVVVIDVVDDKGRPLGEVNVRLANISLSQPRYYTGSTNPAGRATVNVSVDGTYEVNLTRNRYAPMNDKFVVSADQKTYELGYEMPLLEKDYRRGVRVTVFARDRDGQRIRVPNARVELSNGGGGATDANGVFDSLHLTPPGELLEAVVTPPTPEFAKGTGSVTVRANGTLFSEASSQRPGMFREAGKLDLSTAVAVDRIVVELPRGKNQLSGDVVLSKGRVKPQEEIPLTIAVLMSGGAEKATRLQQLVEVIGPKGNRVSLVASGFHTFRDDQYERQNFVVSGDEAGTYTVKARVYGENGMEWSDSAKFEVTPGPAGGYTGEWKDSDGRYLLLTQSGETIRGRMMNFRDYQSGDPNRGWIVAGTVTGGEATWTVTGPNGQKMMTYMAMKVRDGEISGRVKDEATGEGVGLTHFAKVQ